ncbi:MAG: methyltransferase [Alphaproteobacteria bacterium]|nr:methyltransferase [Alphaproteobacteria bacterium]
MGRLNSVDMAAFIAANTRIATAPLVPEIRLHLATEVTPLWQATEATLEKNGLPPPYWAFAWPGGQALARHVLDHPALVREGRVLDFACGCAIAGIAAAKGGAEVTACDLDPMAIRAASLNAALNGVDVNQIAVDFTGITLDAVADEFDLVLAGDVFYERPMAEKVEPWLRSLVRLGVGVLVADPGRAYLPKSGLEEAARYVVPTSRELEDRETRETRVFRLLK